MKRKVIFGIVLIASVFTFVIVTGVSSGFAQQLTPTPTPTILVIEDISGLRTGSLFWKKNNRDH